MKRQARRHPVTTLHGPARRSLHRWAATFCLLEASSLRCQENVRLGGKARLDPALVLGSGVPHVLAHVLGPVHAPGEQHPQRLPVQGLVAQVAQQTAVQVRFQRLAALVS